MKKKYYLNNNEAKVFLGYGYFRELPPCFIKDNHLEIFTKTMSFFIETNEYEYKNFLNENKEFGTFLNYVKQKNKYKNSSNTHWKATQPISYKVDKHNGESRKISVPHYLAHFTSLKFLLDNKNIIFKILNSNKHSLIEVIQISDSSISSGIYYHDYYGFNFDVTFTKKKDTKIYLDHGKIWNSFNNNKIKKYEKMVGNLWVLKTDIKEFYNSVYTHIFGQPVFLKFLDENIKLDKEIIKNFTNFIDKIVQLQNENHTNILLTGPYFSNVVSELLLCAISSELDKELKKETFNYECDFLHYKDDFEFYGNDFSDLVKVKNIFENVLNKFGLKLNSNKTEVTKFNDEHYVKVTLFELFLNDIKNHSNKNHLNWVFELINIINSIESKKIKYFLILLKSNFECIMNKLIFDENAKNVLFSYFINLLIEKTSLSNIIYEIILLIIKNNESSISEKYLEKIINIIKKEKDQDNLSMIYLFYILIEFKYDPNKIIIFLNEYKYNLNVFSLAMIVKYVNNNFNNISGDNIKLFYKYFCDYLENESEYENIWFSKHFYLCFELYKLAQLEKANNYDNLEKLKKYIENDDAFINFLLEEIEFIKF